MSSMSYEEIFAQVERIPIEDVFRSRGQVLIQSGSTYRMQSPFRAGGAKTSFTVCPVRGMFKDWVLPEYTGNAIKFVSLYEGISYFEAGIKLAYEYSIIDVDTYNRILHRKDRKEQPRNLRVFKPNHIKTEVIKSEIASEGDLDKVFRLFVSCCGLSDSHREHLETVRGLTEEEIYQSGFFTFPTSSITKQFLGLVEEEFGSQDVLKGIPGFFRETGQQDFKFLTLKGIGIPILNEHRKVVGIQVRKDTVRENEQRYVWFSSSFAINDEKRRTEFGTSSGSPIDVVYPQGKVRKGIFITEGKFKALQIAKKYDCIAISVQGVSTWKPVLATIKNLMVENPNWSVGKVYTAFDADTACNYSVYSQLKRMTDNISSELSEVPVDYLYWDMEFGKGIDDVILSGNTEKIRNHSKAEFDAAYQDLLDKIKDKKGFQTESEILRKLPWDEFKECFDEFFSLVQRDEVVKGERDGEEERER